MRFSTKLVLFIACGLSSVVSAQAAGSFDGRWSVQLVTRHGDCSPTYQWSVDVSDGRISDGGMFAQTAGAIDKRGRVRLEINQGGAFVAASGRVVGQTAEGNWLSPTKQCSGAWTAEHS